MNLKEQLTEILAEESQKLMQRHHAYHNAVELEHRRKAKRVTDLPEKKSAHPFLLERGTQIRSILCL